MNNRAARNLAAWDKYMAATTAAQEAMNEATRVFYLATGPARAEYVKERTRIEVECDAEDVATELELAPDRSGLWAYEKYGAAA